MSKLTRKSRDKPIMGFGDHQKYITRITKSLYYGEFHRTEELSLPVTELAAEIFSEAQRGKSLNRLHYDDAVKISKNRCVSPCSLILAILYLERLKRTNPDYLEKNAPADLFLVSLMVSSKFLNDDGAEEEVFMNEWAQSGCVTVQHLVRLELKFLKAIKWKIFVNDLTFLRKLTEVETQLAQKQGVARGYFTYTELEKLLNTIELYNILQNIAAITLILVASYATALLSIVGSVVIVSHVPGSFITAKKYDNIINYKPILPIHNNTTLSALESEVLINLTEKTELAPSNRLNVLKTSIFIASIESFMSPFCNGNHSDIAGSNPVQEMSWDWWNIPTMTWLFNESDFLTDFKLPTVDFGFVWCYLETFVRKNKHLELEDHINKATKTRIQDQMEGSWHMEWSDTLKFNLYEYLHNIKS